MVHLNRIFFNTALI